jgi:hypothetical protein
MHSDPVPVTEFSGFLFKCSRPIGIWCIILKWIGRGGVDWIDLAQDRDQWRALVNTAMNLHVKLNSWNFLSSSTTGGFSRRAQLHEVS